MPLQLQLKALLENCDPSAVVIEMIAMLFFDTIIGQRAKKSSSNTDKESNLFLIAIMNRPERRQKCIQKQLEAFLRPASVL